MMIDRSVIEAAGRFQRRFNKWLVCGLYSGAGCGKSKGRVLSEHPAPVVRLCWPGSLLSLIRHGELRLVCLVSLVSVLVPGAVRLFDDLFAALGHPVVELLLGDLIDAEADALALGIDADDTHQQVVAFLCPLLRAGDV